MQYDPSTIDANPLFPPSPLVSTNPFDFSTYYSAQDFPHGVSSQLGFSMKASPYTTPTKNLYADRFIPARYSHDPYNLDLSMQGSFLTDSLEPRSEQELNTLKYQILLEGNFSRPSSSTSSATHTRKNDNKNSQSGPMLRNKPSKILRFQSIDKSDQKMDISPTLERPFTVKNDNPILLTSISRPKIPEKPYKVLEVQNLEDDFYLNPIDWSKKNILAIALRDTIYLWSGIDGTVKKLCKASDANYTSVNWSPDGETLAAGTSTGKVELWDVNNLKLKKDDLELHKGRIGCLGWQSQSIFGTGSQDSSIIIRDIRVSDNQGSIRKLKGHKQEVCSLKWAPNGLRLATGGNDHKVCIWDWKRTKPEAKFSEHQAAVKALAWSPHQSGILLSGGGSNDKTIKVWNTLLMKNMLSMDVESQVCNLAFSPNANEFVSTHGYQNNEIVVWKFPEFTKIKTLEGHKNRVLYLTLSPDGEKIVTGSGANTGASDGSLRFWEVFPKMANCGKMPTMLTKSDLR